MATYQRGVVTTESGSIGLLQSADHDIAPEEALAKDKNGNTALAEYYDSKNNVQIEAVFDIDTVGGTRTAPDLSDIDGITQKNETVTLSNCTDSQLDGKYIVKNIKIAEKNTDYTTLSLTLVRFFVNDIPATT